MKKILLIAAVVLMAVTSASAQQGVKFQDGTLKELLAKAGAENKYLFVDVYAVWCGPCKYMTGEVFTQPTVGEYFNKTFINAKFDAEKGEGIDVAKTYSVKAYPTFLILNSQGKEVARIVGGDEPAAFIKKVQTAVAAIK